MNKLTWVKSRPDNNSEVHVAFYGQYELRIVIEFPDDYDSLILIMWNVWDRINDRYVDGSIGSLTVSDAKEEAIEALSKALK